MGLTSCARLVSLVDVLSIMMRVGLLGGGSLLDVGGDGEVRAVKGSAMKHKCGLGRGGLLEVDLCRVLLLVVLDAVDLPAEPVERVN